MGRSEGVEMRTGWRLWLVSSIMLFNLAVCRYANVIQSTPTFTLEPSPYPTTAVDWSKLQVLSFEDTGDKIGSPYGAIVATSSDGEPVTLEINIAYYIAPVLLKNADLSKWPTYLQNGVIPVVQETVGQVVAEFTALEIYNEKRPAMDEQLLTELTTKLSDYSVLVQDVLVRNVFFTPEFRTKTELDLVATQSAMLTKRAVALPSPTP
jgi:regulator of protease activity HflC (stomatin/prohibitin superfamily)